jgi:RNA polymerase sigma-70 factor (ECF subfamily)
MNLQGAPVPEKGVIPADVHEEFLKLYATAQPALQHFLAAHIPDLHDVDDLMQEVAVCLWKKFTQFVPGTSFRKWAIRVAQFEVLHARRAHARHPALLLPQLTELAAERYADLDIGTVEARRQALDGCLEKLPAAQRDLILARYQDEKNGRDLAEEWGRKENHVWVQMFRIRTALRQCVEGALGANPGEAIR